MRVPRIQFTLLAIMIAVAVVAIWLFIIVEAITYQARQGLSAWDKYH
jgi:Tfp pilus assembly protein PilE